MIRAAAAAKLQRLGVMEGEEDSPLWCTQCQGREPDFPQRSSHLRHTRRTRWTRPAHSQRTRMSCRLQTRRRRRRRFWIHRRKRHTRSRRRTCRRRTSSPNTRYLHRTRRRRHLRWTSLPDTSRTRYPARVDLLRTTSRRTQCPGGERRRRRRWSCPVRTQRTRCFPRVGSTRTSRRRTPDASSPAKLELPSHVTQLMWARENECPWNRLTCRWAAEGGHSLNTFIK